MPTDLHHLYETLDATWPAARRTIKGAWVIRDGAGGGKRVSCATATKEVSKSDLKDLRKEMAQLSQPPLVMVHQADHDLDKLLASENYDVLDPTDIYLSSTKDLAGPLPNLAVIPSWPWVAIVAEIWAAGAIGPERLDVMKRVRGPKTTLLARVNDMPAGVAFVAMHKSTAMIHTIEVLSAHRRQGAARNMIRAAANWAHDFGATDLALAVTQENTAAQALYTSLGMKPVGKYHYRIQNLGKV